MGRDSIDISSVQYNIQYMYSIKNHMISWSKYMKKHGFSERLAAHQAGISRSTWRKLRANDGNIEIKSLAMALEKLGLALSMLATPTRPASDYSTVAVSYRVLRDGENSWKIHYMDFVDEFRRDHDPRLVILPPAAELPLRLKAMLAAIVVMLCHEAEFAAPEWAAQRYDLPIPWFVSETESLKATALLESPLAFRRNGIFVMSNFMERA